MDDTPDLPAAELDHVSTLRRHLLDQLRVLRNAPSGEELALEIRRAKAVTEVAQTIINAARVEVDYVAAVKGASESSFLQEPDAALPPPSPQRQSPLPAPDDPARLAGPSAGHPWRGGSTVHRLKG